MWYTLKNTVMFNICPEEKRGGFFYSWELRISNTVKKKKKTLTGNVTVLVISWNQRWKEMPLVLCHRWVEEKLGFWNKHVFSPLFFFSQICFRLPPSAPGNLFHPSLLCHSLINLVESRSWPLGSHFLILEHYSFTWHVHFFVLQKKPCRHFFFPFYFFACHYGLLAQDGHIIDVR